jgi:pyruvate/2-oxoglutarate dehydrogenase complex dihydrolipoamide dehydrogenase (E3) component
MNVRCGVTHDVVIIGSGSAGFSAAQAARDQGASVCLIEKGRLGGECPNFACVPTKALLKTVKVWRLLRRAREFGILTSGMQMDFAQALAHERRAVETITGGGEVGDRYVRLAKKLHVRVEFGEGRFENAHTLRIKDPSGERTVRGKTFVIATGTEPFIPPVEGTSDVRFLTSKDVLSLRQLPNSVAVIGGGPVGCEFATFFSGAGVRVTFVDPEVASVGLTEPEARKMYKKIFVGEAKIAGLGRAVTESARFGLLKIIAEGKGGRVVGGHMIHAFPTFAEAVTVAAHAARRV